MGLGPPVCEKCAVICEFHYKHNWRCKYCGNTNPRLNLFDCGFTEEQLENNALFLDFVKGYENASTSRGPNTTK